MSAAELPIDPEAAHSIDAFADAGAFEVAGHAPAEHVPVDAGQLTDLPVGARAWKLIAAAVPIGSRSS